MDGRSHLFYNTPLPSQFLHRYLFNTAAGNGIKQLESFISHPTASFLATKCNRLFGLQNWNEKYRTFISKSWWMASSFSSFSYRRHFNTHNTAKHQFGTLGTSGASAPSIVKRQWVFAAFASLYGCVLVTMSAAKILEDQEPEARIHGCMTLTVTKILVVICF